MEENELRNSFDLCIKQADRRGARLAIIPRDLAARLFALYSSDLGNVYGVNLANVSRDLDNAAFVTASDLLDYALETGISALESKAEAARRKGTIEAIGRRNAARSFQYPNALA